MKKNSNPLVAIDRPKLIIATRKTPENVYTAKIWIWEFKCFFGEKYFYSV